MMIKKWFKMTKMRMLSLSLVMLNSASFAVDIEGKWQVYDNIGHLDHKAVIYLAGENRYVIKIAENYKPHRTKCVKCPKGFTNLPLQHLQLSTSLKATKKKNGRQVYQGDYVEPNSGRVVPISILRLNDDLYVTSDDRHTVNQIWPASTD